jgi:hypothetical protein
MTMLDLLLLARVGLRRIAGPASALLLMAAVTVDARAACTPDPVSSGGGVTCSGTDADGFASDETDVSVEVEEGAKVDGAPLGRPSIALGDGAGLINNGSIYYNEANTSAPGHAVSIGDDATITNNGLIESRGPADAGGYAIGIEAPNNALIDNKGSIIVETGSAGYVVFTQARSTVNNDGLISFAGSSGGAIFLQHYSTATNSGTVSVGTTGSQYTFGIASPVVMNSGTVTVTGSGSSAYLAALYAIPGTGNGIVNSGEVDISTTGTGTTASAIQIGVGGFFGTIENSASVSAEAGGAISKAIGVDLSASRITVINTGSIEAVATHQSATAYGIQSQSYHDQFDITNGLTGTIVADDVGISVGGSSKVVNNGEIQAFNGIEMLDDAIITNTGSVIAQGDGVNVIGSSEILNTGVIDAGANAITTGDSSTVINSWTIEAGGSGIVAGFGAIIDNSGSIDASTTGIWAGENSGIDNVEGGVIKGAVGVDMAYSTLWNVGEIVAGEGVSGTGTGVLVRNSSMIENEGEITGFVGISMFGQNEIYNAGEIRGVTAIEGTINNIIDNTGTISGRLDGDFTGNTIDLVADVPGESIGNEIDNRGGRILSGREHAIYIEGHANLITNGGLDGETPSGGLIDSTGSVNGIEGKDAIRIVGDQNTVHLRSGSVLGEDSAVVIDGDGAIVINWSLIAADLTGIQIGDGGLVVNTEDGEIDVGDIGIVVGDGNEVANAGLIVSDNIGIVAGNGNAGMHAAGSETGIVNRGTIDARVTAISVGNANVVTNYGSLDAIEGIVGGDSNVVTNEGLIDAVNLAVEAHNGNVIVNRAGAVMDANSVTIKVVDDNDILNQGVMGGIFAVTNNNRDLNADGHSGITNLGTISTGEVGIMLWAGSTGAPGSNVVTNGPGGEIVAGTGVLTNSASNQIVNQGGIDAGNYGIRIAAGSSNYVLNEGTITSGDDGINVLGGNNSIVNKGTVSGGPNGRDDGGTPNTSQAIGIKAEGNGNSVQNLSGTVHSGTGHGIYIKGNNNAVANAFDPNDDDSGPGVIDSTGTTTGIEGLDGINVDGQNNTITNAATITGGWNGISVYGSGNQVSNTGTITAGYSGIYSIGAANHYNTINNAGTISAKYGVQLESGGVTNTGSIKATKDGVNGGDAITVINAGSIEADGAGVWIKNGTVINMTGAEIIGGTRGIWTPEESSVSNLGTVTVESGLGIDAGSGSHVENGGTVTAGQDAVVLGDGASMVNDGTLNAGAAGIRAGRFTDLTNHGAIDGAGYGIKAGDGSTIDNSGSVEGGIELGSEGRLDNSGTVNGAFFGVAVGTEGSIVDNVNEIQGGEVGVLAVGDGHVIQNYGSIRGEVGIGIQGNDTEILNTGAVAGTEAAIGATQGAVRIINSGTIDGNVVLAGGADRLVLQEGAVVAGNVDTGTGIDSITSSGSVAVDGQITNVEALTVTGGSLSLNVAAGSVVDETRIEGGTLKLDGTLQTTAVVGAEGTLGGNGTIEGDVTNEGAIAPGASIGVLTIDGDYTQTATGELQVELGADGGDLLAVTGAALLDGGVATGLLGSDYAALVGRSYTVLTAGEGVSGTLTTGTLQQGFWTIDIVQSSDAVNVTVTDVDLTIGATASFTGALSNAIGAAAPASDPSGGIEFDGGSAPLLDVIEEDGSQIGQQSASLDYDSMGDWESTAPTFVSGWGDMGARTPATAMPKTGSGTFEGTTRGELTETGSPEAFVVEGDVLLTADFASGLVNADFTGMEKIDSRGVTSAWVDFRARMSIADGTSEFTGTAGSEDGVWNGEAKGGFFGDEGGMPGHAAGLWSMSSALGRALGGFTAKRQ